MQTRYYLWYGTKDMNKTMQPKANLEPAMPARRRATDRDGNTWGEGEVQRETVVVATFIQKCVL